MLARLSAFVIWALIAATAVFWGLKLLARAPAVPAYAVPVGDSAAVRGDLTRLLGAAPVKTASAVAAPEAASRFRLLGIVAPTYASAERPSVSQGVALIAVDGKMPKAYTVGSALDGDLMLQSVSLRTVSIGSSAKGAAPILLELPPLVSAATGTLPPIAGGSPVYVPPPVAVPPYVPPMAPQGGFTPGALQQLPSGVAPPRPEPGVPTQ